jgi:hypothetical protein
MNPQAPDGRRHKQHSGRLAITDPSTAGAYGFGDLISYQNDGKGYTAIVGKIERA